MSPEAPPFIHEQSITFDDVLDPSFQTVLLTLMVRDGEFTAKARGIVKPEYFKSQALRLAAKHLLEYWDTFQRCPARDELISDVVGEVAGEETRTAYRQVVESIYNAEPPRKSGVDLVLSSSVPDDIKQLIDAALEYDAEGPPTREWVEKNLAEFAVRAEAAALVLRSYADLKKFNIQEASAEMRRIERIPAMFYDMGDSLRKTWRDLLDPDPRQIFPTRLAGLDRGMRGGPREGELVSFMAQLKGGKSIVLSNVAVGYMTGGYHTCIISLEMRVPDIKRRIAGILTRRPVNEIGGQSQEFGFDDHSRELAWAMENLDTYTDGDITIKYFPAWSVGVPEIEAYLRTLQADGPPIIPIIDYADYIKSSRVKDEEWKQLHEIYIELRNMGERLKVPIITATQTNAGGFNAKNLGAQHQGGSTRKGMVADYMWAIERDEYDYSVNRFKMIPFINRNARADRPTFWLAEYENAWIGEVDERTWKELGGETDVLDDEGNPTETTTTSRRKSDKDPPLFGRK